MIVATYSKEATASTQYSIDWSDFLVSRTITLSDWTVPAGITNVAESNTTTTTQIQLSGGTWAEQYEIVNTITMNTTEVEERSILIKIQNDVVYATIAETRAAAQGMTTAGQPSAPDDFVSAIIERASRIIDLECGVAEGYFNQPLYPIATDRTFYGDNTNYLRLDPYIAGSLASITLPEGFTAPDYVENHGFLIRTGSDHILWGRFRTWLYGWDAGVPIVVSAQWGYESTPKDITTATIELAINLWREIDPAHIKIVNLEGLPLREKLPPRVQEIVKFYRIKSAKAAFV